MTASAAGHPLLWFRATLATGELLLALPEDAAMAAPARGVPRPLRAAMRLADAEGLIVALEAWTGEELDLEPLDDDAAATQRAAQGVSFEVVATTVAAPVGTRCTLPLRSIARRVAVPPLFRGDACAWRRVNLEVELDVFDLSDAQRAGLRPGRVLLLPASFDAGWRVHLCDSTLGLRLPARWTSQRVLALDPGAAAPRTGALRARLARRATMNPGALLGFGGPATAEIDGAPEADWPAVLEGAAEPGLVPITGELMPAFGGHALRIDGVKGP